MNSYAKLIDRLTQLHEISYTAELLVWDEQVNLPAKGAPMHSAVSSYVATSHHKHLTNPELIKIVDELYGDVDKLGVDQQINVLEVKRDLDKAQKIPEAFVSKLSKLASESFIVWAKAKQAADFSLFEPNLKKLVELKRQEAEYLGYAKHPYDALLDEYEPGMTVAKLDPILDELKQFLVEFLKSHPSDPQTTKAFGTVDRQSQKQLVKTIATQMGFNFEAGRIDESLHPFTVGLHPHDVRITTACRTDAPFFSIQSSMHEAGHGLYEQGLPIKYFGTPRGEAVSLGIHESQSRIWENMVGKNRAFVDYLFPLIQKSFGRDCLLKTPQQLYNWINVVRPSLIRVEADEVTYNLHIVVRYEIEKELMERKLEVKDLPEVWNHKMQTYLGIKVPNDGVGVLQDVHWSGGSIGYFPTYALGNIYAAQLFAAAQKSLPDLEAQFRQGNLNGFLGWLRENIHEQGRRYSAITLIKHATGELPSAKYFIDYVEHKFSK